MPALQLNSARRHPTQKLNWINLEVVKHFIKVAILIVGLH